MHEVLITGLNVVDVLVRLPATLTPGEKHEVEHLVISGGAPAGNAACVLAALGHDVGFLAHLGDNTLSAVAKADFERNGVKTDLFLTSDPAARPGVAVVEIDPQSGERTVFYNLTDYRNVTADRVRDVSLDGVKLVLVDGYETEAALALLPRAREAGVPRVLDLEAGDPLVLKQLLALGSDAILPLTAAKMLTNARNAEDALRGLADLTDATPVVTDGVNGSWSLGDGGVIHQAAFRVQAVDTTGCGDAYHGAYASALLHGLDLPLRMEFAAYVAGRVALEFGGRTNLPTRRTLAGADLSMLSPALQDHLKGYPKGAA